MPKDDAPPFHSLPAMIGSHAKRDPEGIAFREGGQSLRWGALDARVRRVARALVQGGLAPGESVALLGLPSMAYVECLFGIVAARGCAVPLPVSASAETLATMLADCGARRLFLDPAAGEASLAAAAKAADTDGLQVVRFGPDGSDGEAYAAWRDGADDAGSLPVARPDDPFNIIYSSGTTGIPKGIVHLHGMRQRQACRNGFGFGPTSRTLLSTPMYSNTTLLPMIGSLAHGGQCILMRKFDAGRYLALAAGHRATHTMLVPVQYQRLLAHDDFDRSDLSAFELSQSTGAPMSAAMKGDVLARWPGRFLEGYGMTEGGVSCFLDARRHPDKLATVGLPAPDNEVFLIDDAGQRLARPAGPDAHCPVGEIVGRSPFMMSGYLNRPEATADIRWHDAAGNIFHRTGDIGRFDADGFLTLLDRRKDVIISGGNNVYAADLEAVLARHAEVLEAAVIGIPSAAWGESPLALVVARPGSRLDAAGLCAWANAQLGKTQRLAGVELRDTLARSALGKLSKKDLRAPYWPPGAAT